MKKVLFYMPANKITPTGGPGGYLYNLINGLKGLGDSDYQFDFLPEQWRPGWIKKGLDRLPRACRQAYSDWRIHERCVFLESSGNKTAQLDLNEYDIIHLHTIFSMMLVKDSLKDYKGLVLLTSHTPKPPHLEWVEDDISKREYIRHSKDYDDLVAVEAEAFSLADYIIFPCEEAEEPYFNNWDGYKTVRESNVSKYRYFPTGVPSPVVNLSREEIVKRYKLPNNAIILSYVGRHNQTKGYDQLLKIGEKILSRHENVYFLIAGKEEPLKGLKNDRWIEVGWTDQAASIISASDIFVLPNKETYFDIVMLEVLSCGTCVVASNTGGNKYFSKFNDSERSIFLYDGEDEAVEILGDLIEGGEHRLKTLGKLNKELYNNHFTAEIFAKSYLSLLSSL